MNMEWLPETRRGRVVRLCYRQTVQKRAEPIRVHGRAPLKGLAWLTHTQLAQYPTTVVLLVTSRTKLHDTHSQRAMSYQAPSH